MANAIDFIAPYAQRLQQQYGIPASVTIAQYILESGWQPSTLATRYNNPWGVKAKAGEPAVWLPTTEYVNGRRVTTVAPFRVYRSIDEAVEDRGRLLTSSRYIQYTSKARTPYEYAQALQMAGYATDPQYAQKLISLIIQYGLTRYDSGVQPLPLSVSDTGLTTVGLTGQNHDLNWKQTILRFIVLIGLAGVAVFALFQLMPSPLDNVANLLSSQIKGGSKK